MYVREPCRFQLVQPNKCSQGLRSLPMSVPALKGYLIRIWYFKYKPHCLFY